MDPVNTWDSRTIDRYLDSWYELNRINFLEYHREYEGLSDTMIEMLVAENPSWAQRIWDEMVSKYYMTKRPKTRS